MTDFSLIRVRDDTIQTPVIDYQKGPRRVSVAGTFHVGDESYYDALRSFVSEHRVGLYEFLDRSGAPVDPAKKEFVLRAYHSTARTTIANVLGVDAQPKDLGYSTGWVNADFSLEQFVQESTLSELQLHMSAIHAIETSPRCAALHARRLLSWASSKDHYSAKDVDPAMKMIARNDYLLRYATDFLKLHDRFGIVFGALHTEGIDEFFNQEGWERTKVEYLPVLNLSDAWRSVDAFKE